MVTALAVPVRYHLAGLIIAHLGRVEQALRGIAVHHHLAADHAHIAPQRLGKEGVGRGLVHRAIGDRRRRAVADQLVIEMRGDPFSMRTFDETAFLGKGVGVQPLEQVGRIGGDHLHLRKMQVHVDEAGHDQMRAVVDLDHVLACFCLDVGIGADCRDQPILDQQAAILLVEIALAVGKA